MQQHLRHQTVAQTVRQEQPAKATTLYPPHGVPLPSQHHLPHPHHPRDPTLSPVLRLHPWDNASLGGHPQLRLWDHLRLQPERELLHPKREAAVLGTAVLPVPSKQTLALPNTLSRHRATANSCWILQLQAALLHLGLLRSAACLTALATLYLPPSVTGAQALLA